MSSIYLLILQGSQQKDASTATDDVGTSAGAKSQDHLNQSTVYLLISPVTEYCWIIDKDQGHPTTIIVQNHLNIALLNVF